MKRFVDLYAALDETTKTTAKLEALEAYFSEVPAEDAAWALAFLTGNRPKRVLNTRQLREWVAERAGYPDWLVEECYDRVGDLAETMALLLPEGDAGCGGADVPLHRVVEEWLLGLGPLDDDDKRTRLFEIWDGFDGRQRFVWNKLITGGFRVGVQRTLVARALSRVAGVSQATMSHRLMGVWQPTPEAYRALLDPSETNDDPYRPYPFFLASALEGEPGSLGERDAWQAEWKWDGIRAQLIVRDAPVIWTRGEELVTDRYPEVVAAATHLPKGTVLDGEILAWADDAPLPFATLQRRIGRKTVGRKLLAEAPVAFMAYDLLEVDGADAREMSLRDRRARLAETVAAQPSGRLRLSPTVDTSTWDELATEREGSRARGVEGLMLKRLDSPYRVGRARGDWWKWKVDPFHCDAVMIYAQRGHGRRASLYTDYTFGVWHEGELVPVAKAYSGLDDAEIRKVDRFVRQNTVDRFGPVRVVKPELVFELHFEGIQRSTRHKSGIAVRFPRMARWRTDKTPDDADSLQTLFTLLDEVGG